MCVCVCARMTYYSVFGLECRVQCAVLVGRRCMRGSHRCTVPESERKSGLIVSLLRAAQENTWELRENKQSRRREQEEEGAEEAG